MAVRVLSSSELHDRLQELYNALSSLPSSVPSTSDSYGFDRFFLAEDEVEDYGKAGAFNHAMEVAFCPLGRRDGPIHLKEQGPGLLAVVDVLKEFTTEFPQDVVIQKWIGDLLDAAVSSGGSMEWKAPGTDDHGQLLTSGTKRKKLVGDAVQNNKKRGLVLVDNILNRYIDVIPPPERRKGGPKRDPLVDEVAIPCYMKGDAAKVLHRRCAGAKNGCEHVWKDAANYKSRYFAHASSCQYLEPELRQQVNASFGKRSLGSMFSGDSISCADTESASQQSISTTLSESSSQTRALSTITSWATTAGRTDLNKKINYAILKLLCVRGIPPSVVDSREWKDLLTTAAPKYQPCSTSTFVDTLIPAEYAYIKSKQYAHLKRCTNLTISFDGQTTKSIRSVYTIHIITPDRRVFLFEGNKSTTESHTAKYIFDFLNKAIQSIGPQLFRGITSDNTGNTSAARQLVRNTYPWIIILPDPCHRLNLLCKDIAKIDYFSSAIYCVHRTVQFFRKSSHAAGCLREKRKELNIPRGLRSIGKTRFGSLYTSAISIKENYQAISQLCNDGQIQIPVVQQYFEDNLSADDFKTELHKLITVLAPIAKSITCLESTHSTVSDVYIFWLAVAAEIHRILSIDSRQVSVKESIRRAVNCRFNQMINDAPADVYVTGFLLDPRFRGADIMREMNPLAIRKLKIPPRDPAFRKGPSSMNDDAKIPDIMRRASIFLVGTLRNYYEKDQLDLPFPGLSKKEAFLSLREQLIKFQKSIHPFDRPFHEKHDTPAAWWGRLDDIPTNDHQPLAKLARTLFDILPNSMADERTASTFTWLNSPLRNRQEVDTLVRMTTIRQWYQFDPELTVTKPRPTVRFRDLKRDLFAEQDSTLKSCGVDLKASQPSNPVDDSSVLNEPSDEEDEDINDIIHGQSDEHDEMEAKQFSGKLLDVQGQINLNSAVLHDMLSDMEGRTTPNAQSTQQSDGFTEEVIEDDSDFDIKDDELFDF